MDRVEDIYGTDWSLRPWLLAGLLGLAGLLVWLAGDGFRVDLEPVQSALAAFFFFGPLAFAFAVGRERWKEPLVFAALAGLVMAGISWRWARAQDTYPDAGFWMAAGVVAVGLALPLFQAGFHERRWRTSYREAHYHVWTDAISAGGALAFTGLAWLVIALLGQLFAAIQITVLRDLLDEGWFGWTFSGVAFGAALGVLRNQLKVIGTLQSVVMLVFALIAVPLAVALIIFLLAVLFSGLDVLWEATRSATPLLLACAAGSFVLVNSVLRATDAEASGSRIMRIAALVLALGILPLSILAAISMGTRIAQHGLSPERLWALVAIVVAVAFGVAYFVAAIRSRKLGWDTLRQANLHLAVGTSVLAFLLAMPILDFGGISANNQIARLEAGKVSAERFDYEALRWDFGDAGRRALATLVKSDDQTVATRAAEARQSTARTYPSERIDPQNRDERMANLTMAFDDGELREEVRNIVRNNPYKCEKSCTVLDLGPAGQGGRRIAFVEDGRVESMVVDTRDDIAGEAALDVEARGDLHDRRAPQGPDSSIEIREWTGRRIYIDGQPAGEPFE